MKNHVLKAKHIINKANYRDLSPEEFRDALIREARQELEKCLTPERLKIDPEEIELKRETALEILKLFDKDYERFIEEVREKNPDFFKKVKKFRG